MFGLKLLNRTLGRLIQIFYKRMYDSTITRRYPIRGETVASWRPKASAGRLSCNDASAEEISISRKSFWSTDTPKIHVNISSRTVTNLFLLVSFSYHFILSLLHSRSYLETDRVTRQSDRTIQFNAQDYLWIGLVFVFYA